MPPVLGKGSRRGREGGEFLLYAGSSLGIGGEFKILSIGPAGLGVAVKLYIRVAEIQVGQSRKEEVPGLKTKQLQTRFS